MKYKISQAAIFALLLSGIWLVLFLRYLSVTGLSFDLSLLFSLSFAAGHAGEFGMAAFIVMLLLQMLPRKLRGTACVLLGAAATLFFICDYFVYKQFRLHIDMAMLGMFFGESHGDIFIFPLTMYLQAVGGALAVLAVAAAAWALSGRLAQKKSGRAVRRFYALIFVCILLYNGIHAWARFNIYTPVTSKVASLPLAFPMSMNRTLEAWGMAPAKDLPRFEARALQYPLEELRFNAVEKPLNLVVIMLDGWRFDMMNEELTPAIHEFSKTAQRFHMHNAASNHTRHGVFSFFYGLPGVYWDGVFVDKKSPVLMDEVIGRGYQTGIFASAGLTSPEFDQTVFIKAKDFDLYVEAESKAARDIVITDKFIDFINTRNRDAPFFSFLFYDCTHAYIYDAEVSPPRFLPDGGKNYFTTGGDRTLLELNSYKNSIVYGDALVKRVLGKLADDGLMDSTVVIITSDHGEEFDDLGLGYMGHNGNFSRYQMRVPLIVHWPGREPADYRYATSHMDIAPTLMQDMFGCVSPANSYGTGRNLFMPDGRFYQFMMGGSGVYGIQVGEFITVFPHVGASYVVNAGDYKEADWRMPMETYRLILRDLSRFKK